MATKITLTLPEGRKSKPHVSKNRHTSRKRHSIERAVAERGLRKYWQDVLSKFFYGFSDGVDRH